MKPDVFLIDIFGYRGRRRVRDIPPTPPPPPIFFSDGQDVIKSTHSTRKKKLPRVRDAKSRL